MNPLALFLLSLAALAAIDGQRKRTGTLAEIARAYGLTPEERDILGNLAEALQANPLELAALIQFESGWNPRARNATSNASGLIQWLPSTIERQSQLSPAELRDLPRTAQLLLAGQYLATYAPFPSLQSLAMAVFYPVARDWPESKQFPERVQAQNPGIKTVADYVREVRTTGMRPWNDYTSDRENR